MDGIGPPVPKPLTWCRNSCGRTVAERREGEPQIVVVLGREAFKFCGLTCASAFLLDMWGAIYEGEGTLSFLLGNTVHGN